MNNGHVNGKRKAALGVLLVWLGAVMVVAGLGLWSGRAAAAPMDAASWSERVVRLHVVANSDSDEDQALKRAVRDAILAEVTPLFANAGSMAEAKADIVQAIPRIEAAAARAIAQWQKGYTVHATVGRFSFPGKAYGTVFLPAGEYTALKVIIGEGKGANWWCVLWPPLCFVDWSTGVVREPKPGSGGMETVSVAREDLILMQEDEMADVQVRPRFAIWEWVKDLAVPSPTKIR